jgi:alginate O-acetyltransferase complex protein AlgI
MDFFSLNYFVLLITVFILFYFVKDRHKYLVLFIASILFIILISPELAIFSLIFTIVNYFSGLFLGRFKPKPVARRLIFWLSIFIDLGLLVYFKYVNLFIDVFNSLLLWNEGGIKLSYLDVVIPVGISYYTFQSLGYLIRVYRGNENSEQNFVKFGLFLLFFPKFLSGPIERSNHFFPQIENPGNFNYDLVIQGLRLFLWGAFKKIVIANNLYEPVSRIYNDVHSYTGNQLLFVMIIQSVYLYTEFSGYTDMALGSARLFGIDLIDNFNRPFLAKSITAFWKRWHISLTTWCTDFIFYPSILRFRRWGKAASVAGVFLTFFIIGIWHGSKWTYIVLGLLQGAAIVYEFYTKSIRMRLAGILPEWVANSISRIIVFLYFSFSLIFFFSSSIGDAWYFISHLFYNFEFAVSGYAHPICLVALILFVLLFLTEMLNERGTNLNLLFLRQKRWVRWSGYYVLIALIYFFNSEIATFVYMKF